MIMSMNINDNNLSTHLIYKNIKYNTYFIQINDINFALILHIRS